MNRNMQQSALCKPVDRGRMEKLLISVVSGILGVSLGGILLYSGGVIGLLVALPVVVVCSVAVVFLLKAVS